MQPLNREHTFSLGASSSGTSERLYGVGVIVLVVIMLALTRGVSLGDTSYYASEIADNLGRQPGQVSFSKRQYTLGVWSPSVEAAGLAAFDALVPCTITYYGLDAVHAGLLCADGGFDGERDHHCDDVVSPARP